MSGTMVSNQKRDRMSWVNPWTYSVSAQNFMKGALAVLFLGALTGGLGYVLGGVLGYWHRVCFNPWIGELF